MKTKNIFSFKSLIICVFMISFLGINTIISAQTKEVAHTPWGDFIVNGIDGLKVPCSLAYYDIRVNASGYLWLGSADKFILDLHSFFRVPGYQSYKAAKKSKNAGYNGDSIFYIMAPNGTIMEYAMRGCPPTVIPKDTFKTVPANYPSAPVLLSVLGDKLYVQESDWIESTIDTGKTWLVDTVGLGGNCNIYTAGSMGIDTNQTVYVLSTDNASHKGLFSQLTNSNTWTKVPHFVSGNSGLVRVDNKNHLWVITDSLSYSADGGNTWKSHRAPNNNIIQECMDVYGYIYVISAAEMYRSADSGTTWTRIATAISNSVYDTTSNSIFNDITADSALILATNYGSYYSLDKGTTWLMDSIPASTIYGFQQYPNGRKVISTPLATYLQKKGDTTWTQTYPVGVYYPYNPSIAGNAWERPLPKIQQDASGHLFMLGFNTIGSSYHIVWDALRSNDSGSTWISDTLGMAAMATNANGNAPYYVDSMGSQHLCINSNPALVYSKTLSGAWAIDTLGIGAGGLIFAEAFVDANGYLYAAGQAKYTTQYNGRVMKRPISGGSWVEDTSGLGSQWIYTLSKDSKGNIMASEPSSVSTTFLPKLFYRSAATGKWNTANMPPTYHNMQAITGNNPGEWLAYTNYYWGNFSFPYYTNDGVYCSTDSGATWNMIALDSTYIYQLETIGDTVFALTGDGLYKSIGCSNNITTSTQNSTSKIQNSARVYPNPNNGNFTLEYNLPDNDGELRVIDVLGKLAYDSKITNQQGMQTINATGLSEGVYFWQVYSGDKLIEKGKMAVVK